MEQLNFRIDRKDKDALEKIAKKEQDQHGYTVTVADLIRKAVKELVKKYSK